MENTESTEAVTVEVTVEEPPEVTDETPVVIVEDSDADAAVVEAVVENARDLGWALAQIDHLTTVTDQLAGAVENLTVAQNVTAEAVSEVMVEQEVQAVEIAASEEVADLAEIEADEPPETAKTHWFFRPLNEWMK